MFVYNIDDRRLYKEGFILKVVAKPIDMIALFLHNGSPADYPRPLRFRLENDDKSICVIKVDRIIEKSTEKFVGNNMLVFRCQSLIEGQEKVYELKYEMRTCRWILFKI